MDYIKAFISLIPIFSKLVGLFLKTPEEKQAEFLKQLPEQLREISDAFNKSSGPAKDPSGISRIINS